MFEMKQSTLRGILIMLGGLALLLHTLGLIDVGIKLILSAGAIAGIIYGLQVSGLYDYARGLIVKKR